MQTKVTKKELYKTWQKTKLETDRQEYKKMKKEAKRTVARAKQAACKEFYEKLGTKEGEKNIYRVAKDRNKKSQDMSHVKQIKDNQGKVLSEDGKIRDRWKEYFEKLLNEENPRKQKVYMAVKNLQNVERVSRSEIEYALKEMPNHKAVGPDEIPIEVFKVLGEEGID